MSKTIAQLTLLTASLGICLAITISAQGGAPAGAKTGSTWDGVYSAAQATRGEALYVANCSACHARTLEGGDMAPGLTGSVFMANWDGLTVGDLFERIRISMPLDQPGKLARQENADVVAFILKSNQWPAGSAELPATLPELNQIKLRAGKP